MIPALAERRYNKTAPPLGPSDGLARDADALDGQQVIPTMADAVCMNLGPSTGSVRPRSPQVERTEVTVVLFWRLVVPRANIR